MKAKDLNRVQNAIKKSESETLTGAIKSWCKLFNSKKDRLFLFDFKVCAHPYCSDIGRKGFFVPIFYKMIAYAYVLLTHKSVEAVNFKP